jgi:hypothetical protein
MASEFKLRLQQNHHHLFILNPNTNLLLDLGKHPPDSYDQVGLLEFLDYV